MPIIRTFARQGHEIPKGPYRPHGPFPPEIMRQTPVVYEETHGDSLHEALDNDRWFRCKECGEFLHEDELETHICEDEE